MSIGASFDFVTRPFQTPGTAGFPAGLWAVFGEIDGDGTVREKVNTWDSNP